MKITGQIETNMKLDRIGFWSEIKLEIIKKYIGGQMVGLTHVGYSKRKKMKRIYKY